VLSATAVAGKDNHALVSVLRSRRGMRSAKISILWLFTFVYLFVHLVKFVYCIFIFACLFNDTSLFVYLVFVYVYVC